MGSQDLPKVSNLAHCIWCLRRRVCTWGLANRNLIVSVIVLVCMSKTHFAVAAAAVGGDSDHAAGNGVSSSGAGAIKWCCCQCISAAGAGRAGVGTDVVLHTAMENDTTTACKWSWSIRTKRYRFFNCLSFYQALQLRSLYSSMSQAFRLPANYQVYYIKCPFT